MDQHGDTSEAALNAGGFIPFRAYNFITDSEQIVNPPGHPLGSLRNAYPSTLTWPIVRVLRALASVSGALDLHEIPLTAAETEIASSSMEDAEIVAEEILRIDVETKQDDQIFQLYGSTSELPDSCHFEERLTSASIAAATADPAAAAVRAAASVEPVLTVGGSLDDDRVDRLESALTAAGNALKQVSSSSSLTAGAAAAGPDADMDVKAEAESALPQNADGLSTRDLDSDGSASSGTDEFSSGEDDHDHAHKERHSSGDGIRRRNGGDDSDSDASDSDDAEAVVPSSFAPPPATADAAGQRGRPPYTHTRARRRSRSRPRLSTRAPGAPAPMPSIATASEPGSGAATPAVDVPIAAAAAASAASSMSAFVSAAPVPRSPHMRLHLLTDAAATGGSASGTPGPATSSSLPGNASSLAAPLPLSSASIAKAGLADSHFTGASARAQWRQFPLPPSPFPRGFASSPAPSPAPGVGHGAAAGGSLLGLTLSAPLARRGTPMPFSAARVARGPIEHGYSYFGVQSSTPTPAAATPGGPPPSLSPATDTGGYAVARTGARAGGARPFGDDGEATDIDSRRVRTPGPDALARATPRLPARAPGIRPLPVHSASSAALTPGAGAGLVETITEVDEEQPSVRASSSTRTSASLRAQPGSNSNAFGGDSAAVAAGDKPSATVALLNSSTGSSSSGEGDGDGGSSVAWFYAKYAYRLFFCLLILLHTGLGLHIASFTPQSSYLSLAYLLNLTAAVAALALGSDIAADRLVPTVLAATLGNAAGSTERHIMLTRARAGLHKAVCVVILLGVWGVASDWLHGEDMIAAGVFIKDVRAAAAGAATTPVQADAATFAAFSAGPGSSTSTSSGSLGALTRHIAAVPGRALASLGATLSPAQPVGQEKLMLDTSPETAAVNAAAAHAANAIAGGSAVPVDAEVNATAVTTTTPDPAAATADADLSRRQRLASALLGMLHNDEARCGSHHHKDQQPARAAPSAAHTARTAGRVCPPAPSSKPPQPSLLRALLGLGGSIAHGESARNAFDFDARFGTASAAAAAAAAEADAAAAAAAAAAGAKPLPRFPEYHRFGLEDDGAAEAMTEVDMQFADIGIHVPVWLIRMWQLTSIPLHLLLTATTALYVAYVFTLKVRMRSANRVIGAEICVHEHSKARVIDLEVLVWDLTARIKYVSRSFHHSFLDFSDGLSVDGLRLSLTLLSTAPFPPS
jgi:hypothetical protein